MLAAIVDVNHLISVAGYPLLFVLVMSESGGVPVPGETSLIAGAVLASQGKLEIALVIGLAAAAAIVGDNIGYLIGRKGGRWILTRPGAFHRQRLEVLRVGEPFFEAHGPKAVFFGRFLLGLRVWASWLAGATRMRWRSFLAWNALGGITWACAIGLIAYSLGNSAGGAIETFGVYGLVAVIVAVLGALVMHRRQRAHSLAHGHESGGRRRDSRGERAGSADELRPGDESAPEDEPGPRADGPGDESGGPEKGKAAA
jgi:membrane protein DedA with SNARE-associated domain